MHHKWTIIQIKVTLSKLKRQKLSKHKKRNANGFDTWWTFQKLFCKSYLECKKDKPLHWINSHLDSCRCWSIALLENSLFYSDVFKFTNIWQNGNATHYCSSLKNNASHLTWFLKVIVVSGFLCLLFKSLLTNRCDLFTLDLSGICSSDG